MEELTRETKLKDVLTILEREYKDKFETNPGFVGTPEYWKKAGVIELINNIKQILIIKE